ncbi:unnamed protein product [Caenorhabditis brenneri]
MKHWRFFPLLVKEEVLKNMDSSDRLSLSKCSKKCRNLLYRIPNHLESFIVPSDNQLSVDDFLILMTCQKSTIQRFEVKIKTADEKDQVNQFLLKLNKVRNTIKVKLLIMEFSPEYSEMFKKCIDFCDPSFIESIQIDKLDSQEIYEDILKTPQWKNSRMVTLNWYFNGLLKVNVNDVLHFTSIRMKVEELSVDDAWKLVQKIVSTESKKDCFGIRSQIPMKIDLIRHKIETELVGNWKDVGSSGGRYLKHPENPNQILAYKLRWDGFCFGFLTQEQFDVLRFGLVDR